MVLLAQLVGMPVLSGDTALQKSLQMQGSIGETIQAQGHVFWTPLTASSSTGMDNNEEAMAVCSQFIAACNAYTPLSPDALLSLQAPIYAWLRQRQQTAAGQEARTNEASWASMRLRARQHKLRLIRGTVSPPEKRENASTHARPYLSGGQFATIHS